MNSIELEYSEDLGQELTFFDWAENNGLDASKFDMEEASRAGVFEIRFITKDFCWIQFGKAPHPYGGKIEINRTAEGNLECLISRLSLDPADDEENNLTLIHLADIKSIYTTTPDFRDSARVLVIQDKNDQAVMVGENIVSFNVRIPQKP